MGTISPYIEGWYRFENNGIGIGKDDSGHGRHGTVIGVSPIVGKIGGGASYDGTNDSISLPVASFIGTADASYFTVAGWIKIPSVGNAYGLFAIINNWAFYAFPAGATVRFRMINLTTGSTGIYTTSGVIPFDEWMRVAYINNGGVLSLAINTVIQSTYIQPGISTTLPNSLSAVIAATTYYKGEQDEVIIYNKALDTRNLKRDYAGKLPIF